ncbi:ig-like domain-containing protein [Trichonephila inaurata madagascariensis]|uniref:Ig-like domain-containing protein n=1 Tax=Trichonephila inaurata madagascariensis TaxID=2747483 RepID=A0A8X6XGA2_9ARAC|nr:ig-like domain-containing protein [Trichonephila inaurata madagascariensis]
MATGHDCLSKHLNMIDIAQSPFYKLCDSNEEMVPFIWHAAVHSTLDPCEADILRPDTKCNKFPHGPSILMYKTDLASEGTYRCEVSSEAPFFDTVRDEKELRVYDNWNDPKRQEFELDLFIPLMNMFCKITGLLILNFTCKDSMNFLLSPLSVLIDYRLDSIP